MGNVFFFQLKGQPISFPLECPAAGDFPAISRSSSLYLSTPDQGPGIFLFVPPAFFWAVICPATLHDDGNFPLGFDLAEMGQQLSRGPSQHFLKFLGQFPGHRQFPPGKKLLQGLQSSLQSMRGFIKDERPLFLLKTGQKSKAVLFCPGQKTFESKSPGIQAGNG